MSLLSKAREADTPAYRTRPTREAVELAVAFFNGEVTSGQVGRALGDPDVSHSRAWARMAAVLRNAVIHKMVTVAVNSKGAIK